MVTAVTPARTGATLASAVI